MNNPDFLIDLGKKMKEEQAKKNCLLEEVHYLTAIVEEFEPKIDYLEAILNSDCSMTATEIAADYGISARKLNAILHEERVQRKVGNQWVLYVNYMNCGLTKSETVLVGNGQRAVVQTKWTQQGRLLIHEILVERGYLSR